MEKLTAKDQRFLKWYEEAIEDIKLVLNVKEDIDIDVELVLDLCLIRYEDESRWYTVEIIRQYMRTQRMKKEGKLERKKKKYDIN